MRHAEPVSDTVSDTWVSAPDTMVDATISRGRMRDLARPGRFRPDAGREAAWRRARAPERPAHAPKVAIWWHRPSSLRAMELAGKTAVVTGASSGFGAATVRKLREAGVRVVGGARRVERIDADVPLSLDVTDEESCVAFVQAAVGELGGIDILYNNAGLALGRYPFTESTPDDEATVLHTNVDGAIRITRLALPHVRDEGHILFTGSIAGRQAYQNAAVYVAAKFALRGFVYGLREDLLGRPIRITTVDPGLAQTEFSLVRFKGDEEAAREPYVGVEPLTADDVADCVLFTLTRPLHVNIDEMVIKALAQSSGGRILRTAT